MKSFDTRIYLNSGRVPLRHFLVLWHKPFPTENCDIPLLCIKLFDRIFLKHRRVTVRSFSLLWENKFSTENHDNPSPPPPLFHKLFRCQKFAETKKGSSMNFFGILRQKEILRKYRNQCGIDVCKKPLKTVVSFLTVCKSWSKHLYLGRKICRC